MRVHQKSSSQRQRHQQRRTKRNEKKLLYLSDWFMLSIDMRMLCISFATNITHSHSAIFDGIIVAILLIRIDVVWWECFVHKQQQQRMKTRNQNENEFMKWNVGDKSDKDNGNDNHETTRSSKAINVYTANKYRYISSSARTTTKTTPTTTTTVPRAYLIFYGYVQVSMFVLWFQTENINLCKQTTKFHMAVWWLHQTGRNKREMPR